MFLNDYRNSLNLMERTVFDETFDIGVFRTIRALYDASVDDAEIIRVVHKYWGLDDRQIIKRLVEIKEQTVLEVLERYMQCRGFSDAQISEFMRINKVSNKVKSDSELWKLKNKPEKLYDIVQTNKVRKERK